MVTAIEELRKRKVQGQAFLNSLREGTGRVKAFIDANRQYLSPKEVQYMDNFRMRIGMLYDDAVTGYLANPLPYPIEWRTLRAEIDECVAYLLPIIQSRKSATAYTAFRF